MKKELLYSLLYEYGIKWGVNRGLYSVKLKILQTIPQAEGLFEKKTNYKVKRLDLFQINVKELEGFLKALPKNKQETLIEKADKAIAGRIEAFSSLELDYQYPIRWNYHPISNAEWDNKRKWFYIQDFDKEKGDIKVIWEPSRFSHFFLFARAYLLTQNKKYYQAFSRHLSSWLQENPYSYGPNYKCGQECALRMLTVLIVYSVFFECGLITKEDEKNIKKLVENSYQKICSNFFYAYKCIKNNHTLSEIAGRIAGAWCCKDFEEIKKCYQYLEIAGLEQFYRDGGYKQFSFNYQRLALQILECILSMGKQTDIMVSNELKKRILNSIDLLYQVSNENGQVPNYGSNDGALIFPVTSCDYFDYRPALNSLFFLITGKALYEHGIYTEELLWFGGKIIRTNRIKTDKQDKVSKGFIESGYFILRTENSFCMICLQNYKTRPAHMDQLHIDIWYKDKNIFCDSGTYSYASELGRELSKAKAHNTIQVTQKEQMLQKGPFFLYYWPVRGYVKHTETTFEGVMHSKNGYSHKRIVRQKRNGYEIEDQVNGTEEYRVLYHTICKVKIFDKKVVFFLEEKAIGEMIILDGEISVTDAVASKFYLVAEAIREIEIKVCGKKRLKTEILFYE